MDGNVFTFLPASNLGTQVTLDSLAEAVRLNFQVP